MDITWHGNTCFTFKSKTATLVMNPDKSIKTPLKGDVILNSIGEDTPLAEVKDVKKVFDWPGEYEISEIPIFGLSAWTRSRSKEEKGEKGDKTIIFCFEMEKVKVCSLGGLGHKLTSEMIDEIGDVDVLLVPVGDASNLKDKAEEVVDQIDPRIVVLMGNSDPEKHAKEIGAQLGEKLEKLTITGSDKLPDAKREYVVLQKS
jgi:L-ascorbate metabolism protein UlaG (beta-lactamase superfamily)